MDAQRDECRAYAERQGWDVVAVFEDWQTGTELFERAEMTPLPRGDAARRLRRAPGRPPGPAEPQGAPPGLRPHRGRVRGRRRRLRHRRPLQPDPRRRLRRHRRVEPRRTSSRTWPAANATRSRRRPAARVRASRRSGSSGGRRQCRRRTARVVVRKVGYDEDPATIRHLRRMFVELDGGASLRRLAVALEADGVAPPYHARTGSMRWHATTIARILTDRVYIGEAIAYRTESVRERRTDGPSARRMRPRAEEEWVRLPDGTAPVVIDPALFARVQRRLDRNKTESLPPRPRPPGRHPAARLRRLRRRAATR